MITVFAGNKPNKGIDTDVYPAEDGRVNTGHANRVRHEVA